MTLSWASHNLNAARVHVFFIVGGCIFHPHYSVLQNLCSSWTARAEMGTPGLHIHMIPKSEVTLCLGKRQQSHLCLYNYNQTRLHPQIHVTLMVLMLVRVHCLFPMVAPLLVALNLLPSSILASMAATSTGKNSSWPQWPCHWRASQKI